MTDLNIALYRKLYRIRRSEEKIIEHYPEDQMRTPMHMSMGQEAISVGVCHAIGSMGQVFASYRSHAAFLAKTEDTDKFFGEMYGKEVGTAQGKAGSLHLSDPDKGHIASSAVVGGTIPMAVGAAYANKQRRNGQLSCVFFGEGALDEGGFWESLNVACAMRLPVLFVCEDNGFAVHTPKDVRQGYLSITDVIRKFEVSVVEDDTTDTEAIYRHARDAIKGLLSSGRPAFLCFRCFRYLEHVGVGDDLHLGFRSASEMEEWRSRDSLAIEREKLFESGLTEQGIQKVEREIDRQIETSIKTAQGAPYPQPSDLPKGVFHEAAEL